MLTFSFKSTKCMSILEEAGRFDKGRRVDAFVQSTDKNFMVPVGGSIIAGFDEKFIEKVSATYPGNLILGSLSAQKFPYLIYAFESLTRTRLVRTNPGCLHNVTSDGCYRLQGSRD